MFSNYFSNFFLNISLKFCFKFTHPLYHLGKNLNDCPVVAIDSFSHMYVFKKTFDEIVRLPHLLTFANDLHSGKLHREFHHGPDPGKFPFYVFKIFYFLKFQNPKRPLRRP